MTEQKTQPVKKFRAGGGISAAVWERQEIQEDGTLRIRYSVSIQKRYRDKEGNWQDSDSYFANDLPKLQLVAGKAYEFVTLNESDTNVERTTATE